MRFLLAPCSPSQNIIKHLLLGPDKLYETTMLNHVAKRASGVQGVALLTLWSESKELTKPFRHQ
ncbi:hypothetical protein EV424DRAFT_413450 [Suillus variegatus]|nr:hypothetical protein EV424DRAFT_413450 [Suillus variegatus]